MPQMERKYRREPKSLADFQDVFKTNQEEIMLRNPLKIGFSPYATLDSSTFTPVKFIEVVESKLKKYGPENVHFLMPRVGSEALGEFLKGVLKVISPDLKVPVTSYKTPARYLMNRIDEHLEGGGFPHEYLGMMLLESKLKAGNQKALSRHGTTRETTQFIVIDNWGQGTTYTAIKRQLGKEPDFVDLTEFCKSRGGEEFHMTLDKSLDGTMNISRGNLLEVLLTQDPNKPKIKPDDLVHRGELLFKELEKGKFIYFTKEEITRIYLKEICIDSFSCSWPKIIDYMRDNLSPERQKEIIRKMKENDKMVARAAYQYGIAQTKEYRKTHSVESG